MSFWTWVAVLLILYFLYYYFTVVKVTKLMVQKILDLFFYKNQSFTETKLLLRCG